MKKSYNPLKMWGSWVGSILFLMLMKILYPQTLINSAYGFETIIYGGGYLILGFLLGWGIHSLVRAIRK